MPIFIYCILYDSFLLFLNLVRSDDGSNVNPKPVTLLCDLVVHDRRGKYIHLK